MKFSGYRRLNGDVGIRNYVLVLPVQRVLNSIARKITEAVKGTETIVIPGEIGRTSRDREVIANTLLGLALNGNVGGVLVLGDYNFSCRELDHEWMSEKIAKTGKPVEMLDFTKEGGYYNTLGNGIKKARQIVYHVSRERRKECDLSDLTLGVKCGMSDPTSGISGNPVVGELFDILVSAGGTAVFSETTEIIGGEHMVASRCQSEEVKEKLYSAVEQLEKKAKSTGEDIRKINPIPENIRAGITTLEEKSLGAITKSGSSTIKDVIKYGDRISEKGLYFMDAWMSSLSLPLGNAAAGVNLFIYQMGGQGIPQVFPPMPSYSGGIITPIMYVTGNPRTYEKAIDNIDFSSGDIIIGESKIQDEAEKLLSMVIDTASGTYTKSETMKVNDPVELYLEGPCL